MNCPNCRNDNIAIAKFCVKCGTKLTSAVVARQPEQPSNAPSVDRNTIIRDAQMYAAKGRYDKAIAEWQKLLRSSNPEEVQRACNAIGDLYLKMGKKHEAIKAYHQAAESVSREGHSAKAIACYKKIISQDPNRPEVYVALGDLYGGKALIAEALENFNIAAVQYAKDGERVKALSMFQKMADLNPSNATFHVKLAEKYAENGLFTEAVRSYIHGAVAFIDGNDFNSAEDALKTAQDIESSQKVRKSEMSTAYGKVGESYNQKNHHESGLKYLNRAILLGGADYRCYYQRGISYHALNQIDKAIADFNKAIELQPDDGYVVMGRGYAYYCDGKYQKALLDVNKAIEIGKFQARGYELKGHIHKMLKQYEDARQAYTDYMVENLSDAPIRVCRGGVYLQLGQYDNAIADFSRAIELNPNEASAFIARGQAYLQMVQYMKALADFNKAIEINGDDKEAYFGLACVNSLQHKQAEACEFLRKAITKGFNDWERIRTNADLEYIRSSKCFTSMLIENGQM